MTWSKHLGSFKEKSLGLTDSNAKIPPVYELKTKILKKKKNIVPVSGIVSSTLPTSHT